MGNRSDAELTIKNIKNFKSFDLIFQLYSPNLAGEMKLDLWMAKKTVNDPEYGATTLLEALFSRLSIEESVSMFKILQFHEESLGTPNCLR